MVYEFTSNETKSFIVFQVKYIRNPQAERDPHKWLLEIIASEQGKIQKLIPKGATKYYLIWKRFY